MNRHRLHQSTMSATQAPRWRDALHGDAAMNENPPHRQGSQKGERTRRRIMEAVVLLLDKCEYSRLRITEVARAANITQAHFYLYFSTVEDVVYAIALEAAASDLNAIAELDSTGKQLVAFLRQVVEAAFDVWKKNYLTYSVAVFLSDKGVERFKDLKRQLFEALNEKLVSHVQAALKAENQSADIHASREGYVCWTVIQTMATQYKTLRELDYSHERIADMTVQLVLTALGFVCSCGKLRLPEQSEPTGEG